VKVEVKNGEGLTRELSAEIPAETVHSEIDKRLAELGKDVRIDGFRKGKAPLGRLRAEFGDKVKMDVIDDLFRQSLTMAIDEHKLKIAGRPTVTALNLADDGTLTYQAELEVFPEIGKVNYQDIQLQAADLTVRDQEVDAIVEHLRKQFSELRSLDRPAEENDVVEVDLTKVADPNGALDDDSFPGLQIDLSSPATIKEFKEQLPGVKAGDEKEIEVVYDDDYSDPTFAGAHVTYSCRVKSVNERILPDVDDAFAKRTGMGETALELRLKVRERLVKEKENEQGRAHRRELVSLLCSQNDVAIPEGPVGEYLDNLVKDFRERGEEFDEKALREKYRPVGIKSMQWDLLWRALVEQEKIEVLPEDTENWIKGFATYHKVTVEQATESLHKAGKIQDLRESILEEKVLNFLLGQATLVPVKK